MIADANSQSATDGIAEASIPVLDYGQAPPPEERIRARFRRYCLIVIMVAFAGGGAFDALAPQADAAMLGLLVGAPVTFACLVWVQLDAKTRKLRVRTWLFILMLLLPPLGVLVYLAAARRFKSMLKAIGFLLLCGAVYGVAGELAGLL